MTRTILGGAPLRGLPLREQTFPGLLERQAKRYGDKTLLRMGPIERSYAEARDATARAAGLLQEAGIEQGDRIALMCENRIELLDLILGATWMGAVAVPLNTALRGEQLAHQLRNSGAHVLAMDSALVEVLAHVEGVDALDEVWALDGVPGDLPAGLTATVRDLPPATGPVAAAGIGPGDTAAILQVGRLTAASATVDPTLLLTVLAAVLIGGTSFTGGEGGVLGTVIGVIFLGVVQNGLTLSDVSTFWQGTVSGVILIAAVGLGVLRDRGYNLRQRRVARAPADQTTADTTAA